MGRSKFPGKPPKTVSRKRIKVLGQPEPSQSDSVTVAENIYYGLSLFNETFGDNEKEHPPFHGFSSKEAKLSVSYIKTQHHDAENDITKLSKNKDESNVSSSNTAVGTADVEISLTDNPNSEETCRTSEPMSSPEKTSFDETSKEETNIKKSKCYKSCKNLKFPNFMKTPVLKSVKNILDQHQRTRQLRNSTAKRLLQRAKSNGTNRNLPVQSNDKANNVRKFVLPIRSAHSSRVIKPNKRFIEELEEKSSTVINENDVGFQAKKIKINPNDSKLAEVNIKEGNNAYKKLKSKEGKQKARKLIPSQNSKDQGVLKPLKTNENVEDCNKREPLSKLLNKDTKKNEESHSKSKPTNKMLSPESSDSSDPLQNGITFERNARNTKIISPRSQKQISAPIKVLPDSNVPNFESSRVQTRSGAQNEISINSNQEECVKLTNNSKILDSSCEDNSAVDNIANNCGAESTTSDSESEHSEHSEDEQSDWTGMKLNGGKVILRKARLKLDNKCLGGTEGPFSVASANTNLNGNSSLGFTSTVKCGVCGAVRFYRFVKQARKFGIHSCESCRKFISKMIKRQTCAKSTNNTLPILQCHKGDGLCLVPPIVRSQQWNVMRCVYKTRCPACWLKMCLKCYNIPVSLRSNLNMLLPPIMRDPVSTSVSVTSEEMDNHHSQKLSSCKISWPAEDSSEKNLFKSAMNWKNLELGRKPSYETTSNSFLYSKINKNDLPISSSPSKKRRKDNRIKVRKKLKGPVFPAPSVNQCSPPLRQRLDLKGPRVKHVCRSASVALGQPIATFPSIDGKDVNECSKTIPKTAKENEKVEKRDEIVKDREERKNNNNVLTCNTNLIQQPNVRRGKLQQTVSISHTLTTKNLRDAINTISIDFWEQYDPTEVGAKGFALIASEPFHIPAICYLCGSSGKEPLIHCQCCCEPYHAFCLEPSEWNACMQPNWCCPRCTICQTCHVRSGPKLSCIRCRQSFHHSCLSKSGVSARIYSPERPYVCQNCIRCKSCGSEGVNVHVGNLPLCSMCFKLRQRGNYCPLCQRCYNENDFDTKMMECNECSCWVHAQCEGLSDEQYQILSYLPDSIEFTCRQCSTSPNPIWRNAVEAELKAGLVGVIKSLSKNRKTCAALKWSPRKECLCRLPLSVRKLEFLEDILDIDGAEVKETSGMEDIEESNSEKSADMEIEPTHKVDSVDQLTDTTNRRGLRRVRQKLNLKDITTKSKNNNTKDQESERKDLTLHDNVNSRTDMKECNCSEQQIIARPSPTLLSIKRKVNSNEYKSLSQFHFDMEYVINRVGTKDLTEAYYKILKEVFPWFNPKVLQSETDVIGVELSNKNVSKGDSSFPPKNDFPIDAWKEDLLKVPKTIPSRTSNLYNVNVEDSRSCCLCKGLGDGQEIKEGRLLYCGQNEWVHANCALWSNEVFEEIDGSLQNVHSAISRGRMIRCTECGKKGASVGCCAKNCSNTYHYPCARSISLSFNDDKTVFCLLHLSSSVHKTQESEINFNLNRPVYVELDRKKKKYAEPDKVKVMIGSLMIDSLGSIVPEYSDTMEKIIPCEYKCSRLYWSTVNPFKIVRYYIRTYLQVHTPDVKTDMENNITIDHSQELKTVNPVTNSEKLEYLTVKQTLEALIDSVCNKEVDENLAEQSNTDLLPPELKEAIFEDLPHDLLDGISMQDIFPKLTYEDFLAMDSKADNNFATDLLKDDMLSSEVEEIMKPNENKISKQDQATMEAGSHNDLWYQIEAKGTVQELVDDLLNSKNQKRCGKELKRSKSEVISNNALILGEQKHHQRSCSLTWSCKLDAKRRKLPKVANTSKTGESGMMILDSSNDRTSGFHELRIPESIMVTVGRANTPAIISDSVREFKYCVDETHGTNRRVIPAGDNGKEHKRPFWQTRQQPRILQVDGPADASSASECSSPEHSPDERMTSPRTTESRNIPQLDGMDDENSCDGNENKIRVCSSAHNSILLNSKKFIGILKSHMNGDRTNSVRKYNSRDENSLKVSFKIPQLDGAGDISSDEECVSVSTIDAERLGAPYVSIDKPVTCRKCQCTYRTQDSYNRHLSNCDTMITSDSDSETMDNKLASPDSTFSSSVGSVSPRFIALSPSEGHTLSSDYPDIQATSPIEASVPSPHPGHQIEPIAQAIITPQIHTHATVETVHQTVLTSNEMIVQTQYTRTTTTLPNPAVLPQESSVQITEITDSPSITNESGIGKSFVNASINSPESPNSQTVHSPQISPRYSSNSNAAIQTSANDTLQVNVQTAKVNKSKPVKTPRQRTKTLKSQMIKSSVQPQQTVRYQTIQNNTAPVVQIPQTQRTNPGATVILQQVTPPGIVSYVETLQQQSNQNLQYITTIGTQHETGFKPQFITANPLVSGAYIQAPSDNLLTLQNGGISILPSVQIAQPQPTVLGTIIQQQPSAIQCGVISSEQLLLSSTPTLEMFTDSTGSMFVSNQPMYYGLETIVSNTVMSSSQFMAGPVPQVLASSYQTTTQVFQASKLMESMVDVQTVPAVPTVTTMQAIQNTTGVPSVASVPTMPNVANVANVPALSTVQNVSGISTVPPVTNVPGIGGVSGVTAGYVVVNQSAPTPDPIQTAQLSISTASEQNFPSVACNPSTSVSCQSIVASLPNIRMPEVQLQDSHVTMIPRLVSSAKPTPPVIPPIPRVAVRPSPVSQSIASSNPLNWKINESLFGTEQPINSNVRPYFDSKHVSENTSMIKSSISSKIPPLPTHCISQRDMLVNKMNADVNANSNYIVNSSNSISSNTNTNATPVATIASIQNKISVPVNSIPTSRPMNRVLPMQAITPKQDTAKSFETSDIVIKEPTKPIVKAAEPEVKESERNITESIKPVLETDIKENTETKEFEKKTEVMEEEKEKSKDNESKLDMNKDKLQNSPLKIVLQKQLQDGSYKITHNMNAVVQAKKSPPTTLTEVLSPKKIPQITSLQLLPIKTFTLKTNKVDEKIKSNDNKMTILKTKVPPVAVKKPRIIAKTIKTSVNEPSNYRTLKNGCKVSSLMYEIKSQDGFTHTASSMNEIWESVFQAVQNARKAHNLPPLPYNPLTENLGLENNATVYLIEQLPGVNRCTKYKPRFHKLSTPKLGEIENDLPTECDNGAARAEPFKGRKVHDMFSWLASRHRQQPKLISISEAESRRVASTNLPMAMRFRILKETSKESVGVYHSHIHGRGLFCLRDIEAGEMVIEYAGEVIRASLTDKREKYYDSKNIGCYMFKIDDHLVVDATMKGNAARFINHSCEPNCYSRVVDILGKKHILIFALRRIAQGEELTYDYKFPFEDIKIPCTCGSRRCRKYLN